MSRGRKNQDKIISAKVHNVVSNVPDIPTPTTRRVFNDQRKWHKFGTDNLFPQAVALLTRRSPVHRGIIKYKTIYTVGKGFSYDEANQSLSDMVMMANNKNETLRDVAKKLIQDRYTFGNAYLEIMTDARGSFVSLSHIDATKVRLSKENKSVLIASNWEDIRGNSNTIKEIPLYPESVDDEGVLRSVWHFKEYEPEFVNYGVPTWIAALDAVAIGYKTNKWNLSRLDNSFQTSGVLLVDGNMSAEDAAELQNDFAENMTGEGNQGKVLMIVKQMGKSEGTQFVPINSNNEGDWMDLHQQSSDDLVIAHNWFRSLAGIADNTGFDTKRILNEYDIAVGTVIEEEQSTILSAFNMILDRFGIDASSLDFINKPPVSIATMIDVNKIVTKGEARQALGLTVDEDDIDMDNFIEQ